MRRFEVHKAAEKKPLCLVEFFHTTEAKFTFDSNFVVPVRTNSGYKNFDKIKHYFCS